MASNKLTLQPVYTMGRLMGFANMFRKETREWWRTRTWLIHSIIWLVLINGILLAVLTTPTPPGVPAEQESGVLIFVTVGGLMTGIGIVIVMQGAILDEKKSGTAAWVLSKPLSRPAFILAKLTTNALTAVLIMIILQGVVAYIQLRMWDANPPMLLPFLAGLGLMALHLLFYLSLTLMLGTLFNERGAVLGIPIGLLFGAQLLMGFAPALAQVMPWLIVLPSVGNQSFALAQQVMMGLPLPTITPIIATIVWIVLFTGVAVWRFEQEEF